MCRSGLVLDALLDVGNDGSGMVGIQCARLIPCGLQYRVHVPCPQHIPDRFYACRAVK